MSIRDIPVIDIGALHEPATLWALDRACREWGFFQVTRHGIGEELLENLMGAARGFFARPTEVKRRILRSAENPWGFFDRELTKNVRDLKEIFDYGPADGEALRPRWPTGVPGFEPAVRAYYAACEGLARRLLAAIAENLETPPAQLLGAFEGPHSSFLRLNYYPACPAAGEGLLGVNPHTDSGALTLLLQDRQPGLEVFRDGRWHRVAPRADALVVNLGDIVQVWSNDRYRAALHRVVVSPNADRYSAPFFYNPSYATDYAPLPAKVDAGRPARYRSINWGEFRALRAAGDYADLGEEVQLAHYLA